MKDLVKIARMLALFGQLGFTIVTPPIVLALLAHHLQRKYSLGSWVMAAAIVLGLIAAASGVYGYYRRVMAFEKKQKKEEPKTIYFKHE